MTPIGLAKPLAGLNMASNTGSSCDGERLITLEHLACRGLVLERLLQLSRARLHLLEQPSFSIAMTA